MVDRCDKYYLLRWQGDYLIHKINTDSLPDEEESFIHQSVRYYIRFLHPLTAHKLVTCSSDQYIISLRKLAVAECGVALIKSSDLIYTT